LRVLIDVPLPTPRKPPGNPQETPRKAPGNPLAA